MGRTGGRVGDRRLHARSAFCESALASFGFGFASDDQLALVGAQGASAAARTES